MTSTSPAKKFLRVKQGSFVYLPARLMHRQRGAARIWLKPGDVIDATDAFITHCLDGQQHKLSPAPDATEQSKRVWHPLVNAYRKELLKKGARKVDPKKEEARSAAKKDGLIPDGGIPPVDLPPSSKVEPPVEGDDASDDADPGDEQTQDPVSTVPPKRGGKK